MLIKILESYIVKINAKEKINSPYSKNGNKFAVIFKDTEPLL
jgi:hypothetical protein